MQAGQISLIRLFEAITNRDVAPKPDGSSIASRMGGGGLAWKLKEADPLTRNELHFASAAMAMWLSRNTLRFFMEAEKAMSISSGTGRLTPLILTQQLLDYFETETYGAPATERASYLAHIMINAGLGLSPDRIKWESALRTIAIDEDEDSNLTIATRRLVEWAFEVEVAGSGDGSLEQAELTLGAMLRRVDDMPGLEMNQWAYFMLRLGLFRAASPLAKRALAIAGTPEFLPKPVRPRATEEAYRYSVAMCQDTYAWALCYEGNFGEAKFLLANALTYFSNREEWYEVQFHRAHAAFWSGEHKTTDRSFQQCAIPTARAFGPRKQTI